MPYRRLIALFAGLLIILTTLPVTALARDNENLMRNLFTELERRSIEEYYHGRYGHTEREQRTTGKKAKKKRGLPPGLAKRETLPPGLARQLKRNGHLPPGLEKRDLPEGLSRLLPRRSPDQRRVIVDNDVLLIENATGLILDIIRDVF